MILDGQTLKTSTLTDWAFRRAGVAAGVATGGELAVGIDHAVFARVEQAHQALGRLMENKIPIYGVTTGFGDSGSRTISYHQSEQLQKNLVAYLLCGSGPILSAEATRAILTIRLNSM